MKFVLFCLFFVFWFFFVILIVVVLLVFVEIILCFGLYDSWVCVVIWIEG